MERLLQKLEESVDYDKTLFLIVSDHGYAYPVLTPPSAVYPRALPLILIKPFHSRGEMKRSDAPVHLQDIPKTVLSSLNINNTFPGLSILESKDSDNRVRRYLSHTWKKGMDRERHHMPVLSEFLVEGFSWSFNSWRRTPRTFESPDIPRRIRLFCDGESSISLATNLLNGDKERFWEVGGPYPHWLMISYPGSRIIKGYTFVSGPNPEANSRMPKEWTLEGFKDEDGEKWQQLDHRSKQKKWQFNEARSYDLRQPGEYKYYRFTFQAGNDPTILRMYNICMME